MESKKYIDILMRQADIDHLSHEQSLCNFLDFLLKLFDYRPFLEGMEVFESHLGEIVAKKPELFTLVAMWLNDVSDEMAKGRWLDAFGILYEELYLSRGKASSTGQFFTPPSVSDMMSELTGNAVGYGVVNDCAAGSGRLLLSSFMNAMNEDKEAWRKYEYVAQDRDPMAAKMCALNMMAHGMRGTVECRDTLEWDTPSVVYHINEVRYPVCTPFFSVRVEHPKK